MRESAKRHLVVFIYAALISSTLLVYWQVSNFDFVNFDDDKYVTMNPHVLSGLTWDSVIWAFTTAHASFWHPVTWLSLMVDRQLFGLNPGWFHLVNVFLHIANTLLLFTVLRKMTGSLWPSAFVAAAFALHPMHVESVAWIAERKDVLSTLFLLLTLAAYAGYVKRPSVSRYIAAIVIFAVGLMAKPMLITLPFLLLLLDYWPLNRFDPQSRRQAGRSPWHRLIIEKIPFLVLAIVFGIITFVAQQKGGGIVDIKTIPLPDRVGNAFLSYAAYIGKMFWPQDIAVHYPSSPVGSITLRQFALPALLLACVSLLVLRFWRTRKYLLVGWLWFVGTLIPVIGLVKFTGSSYADRFTYVPYIGLFIMVAWAMADVLSARPRLRLPATVVASAILFACALQTWHISGFWKDSVSLFERAAAVTKNNSFMHKKLGEFFYEHGQFDKAQDELANALTTQPDGETWYVMARVMEAKGRPDEAMQYYLKSLAMTPNLSEANLNLGLLLNGMQRYQEAERYCRKAIALTPKWAPAYSGLGATLGETGRLDEGLTVSSKAVELDPKLAVAHRTLASILAKKGDYASAAEEYRKSIAIEPDLSAWNNLGDAQLQMKQFGEAEKSFRQAITFNADNALVRYNLGMALAELGRKEEALEEIRKSLALDPNYADTKALLKTLTRDRR